MAAVEEIGTLLQSLQALKAPGVTQSKVKEISQKAVDNIQVGDSPQDSLRLHPCRVTLGYTIQRPTIMDAITVPACKSRSLRHCIVYLGATPGARLRYACPGSTASRMHHVQTPHARYRPQSFVMEYSLTCAFIACSPMSPSSRRSSISSRIVRPHTSSASYML